MKRDASPVRPRRLKSRRLSDSWPLERQQPLADWTECEADDLDKTDFSRALVLCQEYNDFMPLCMRHAGYEPFSNVARCGSAFQKAVREVEHIIRDARLKVQTKCDEMEYHLDDLIVACGKSWNGSEAIGNGNLFALELSAMKDYISKIEVDDKGKFVKYAMHEIRNSLRRDQITEEFAGFNKISMMEQEHVWLDKALALMQKLIDIGCFEEVLPTLVVLKSLYRLDKRRLRHCGNFKNGQRRIDNLITAWVTREIPDEKGAYLDFWKPNSERILDDDEYSKGDPMEYECTIDVDGLGWTVLPRNPKKDYWNLPSCVRTLREAYIVESLTNIEDCVKRICDNDTCFHQQTVKMLEWLQKKAWSEVRTSVMLTAGAVLPVELAEKVFDYALIAEEIPANPCVKETIVVNVPDWMDEEAKRLFNVTGPRPFTGFKLEYCCCRIRRGDPESVFLARNPPEKERTSK